MELPGGLGAIGGCGEVARKRRRTEEVEAERRRRSFSAGARGGLEPWRREGGGAELPAGQVPRGSRSGDSETGMFFFSLV